MRIIPIFACVNLGLCGEEILICRRSWSLLSTGKFFAPLHLPAKILELTVKRVQNLVYGVGLLADHFEDFIVP